MLITKHIIGFLNCEHTLQKKINEKKVNQIQRSGPRPPPQKKINKKINDPLQIKLFFLNIKIKMEKITKIKVQE